MKSQTAFVRSDCAVHLDTETSVDLNFAFVINPRNSENDYSFRLNHSFKDFAFFVLRILVDEVHQGFYNFFYSLMKFAFTGVLCDNFRHEVIDFSL